MQTIKKLNKVFTQCFLKNWQDLTPKEELLAAKRKELLNSQFEFTDEAIKKLRRINHLFQQQEKRVKQHSNSLFCVQQKWLEQKSIDAYEVDVLLQCFNENYYMQWHGDFEENPFYSCVTLMHVRNTDDVFYTNNFNEFSLCIDHPLANDFHCFTFYHLYNNTYLAWEDILRIEKNSMVMVVQNEFGNEME